MKVLFRLQALQESIENGQTVESLAVLNKEVLQGFKKRIARDKHTCPICSDIITEEKVVTTSCGHLFCKPCLEQWMNVGDTCPTCRKYQKKALVEKQ